MTERFAQYDGGKGPEDRSSNAKRASSPLWKQVKLRSGIHLTPEEAAEAMEEAYMCFLEINNRELNLTFAAVDEWVDKYFPNPD